MDKDKIAECVVCQTPGQGTKDFLCDNCGHPDKIYLACLGCGKIYCLTPEDLERLAKAAHKDIPVMPGITIKTNACSICDPDKQIQRITHVYSIH